MHDVIELGHVHSTPTSHYPVLASDNIFEPSNTLLQRLIGSRQALFVTSPTVDHLYGSMMDAYISSQSSDRDWRRMVLPSGEANKSIDNVMSMCSSALRRGLGRLGVIVAVGGGTLMDVAAFAAGIYRRGVAHIRIGTTLLGQVDASVGAKCGVNFRHNKNFIGAFHPPAAVVVDTTFLATLQAREIRSGMAEIVKLGMIGDLELLGQVERWRCEQDGARQTALLKEVCYAAAGKIAVMLDGNLLEGNLQRSLDFGHLVSPLLEIESAHHLNHGEAVAVDIASSTLLANRLGYLADSQAVEVVTLLKDIGLRIWHPSLTVDLYMRSLSKAREHRGHLNMPLPSPLGSAEFVTDALAIPPRAIEWSLSKVREMGERSC